MHADELRVWLEGVYFVLLCGALHFITLSDEGGLNVASVVMNAWFG